MDFLKELITHQTGNASAAHHIMSFLCLLTGAFINVCYDAWTRNESSRNNPVRWNWKYYWRDNRVRFGLNLLMAMMVVLLFDEWTGKPVSMGNSLLIGLGFDGMYVVYKKLHKRVIQLFNTLIDLIINTLSKWIFSKGSQKNSQPSAKPRKKGHQPSVNQPESPKSEGQPPLEAGSKQQP